eukprot:TRINITY_DN9903_c0_g1_i1.p1 TRINITY_DN9903_c0_g1~~TRINITY_DN9903_c0_g1_i1.p1  ORF type:complete len:531 (+),score=89.29 TRINITY_DN9903_c0_g1_i1:22-1593(+)
MKAFVLVGLLVCSVIGCQPPSRMVAATKQHLFPLPRNFTYGNVTVTVSPSFSFAFEPAVDAATQRQLDPAIQSFLQDSRFCGSSAAADALPQAVIVLRAEANFHPEGYELEVSQTGIKIVAGTVQGARYAITTLRQLLQYDSVLSQLLIPHSPWHISDAPVFGHRGVMIDTSRSFLPMPLILRTLEGMAYVKLNVLHWHMVDATSFPFYSKSHPNLTKFGAYGPDMYYSLSNISTILAKANDLGITIVPEIDTPGHSFAWGLGYPTVVMCNQEKDQTSNMCPEPPCGNIRVSDSASVSIVHDVYTDLMDAFPGKLVHVGADEVSSQCWGSDTEKWFSDFEVGLHQLLTAAGRQMVVWGGAITDFKIPLPTESTIIQTWDSDKTVPLQQGYRIIDSNYKMLYLDCGEGNWISGGASWCDPFKTWDTVYNYNPLTGVPPAQQAQVLGGEVCVWGETIDGTNFETKLWPRAAAAAERFWDNPTSPDMIGALHRLRDVRNAMLGMGIAVTPLQPQFCATSNFCDIYK